jgi:hypothetical protein
VRANLSLAAADDIRLRKSAAFERLALAVRLDPGNDAARDVDLARRIVRNHFSVYHDETSRFVAELRSEFPEAPLVAAISEAYDIAERAEAGRRARYLAPER